ncbi:MAG TPA: redoxin domain-containing protein [Bryobacteraceae bacterium]|nr:redoxin domain-containing protein [Bryobacteraceae bacterium]
MAPILLSAAAGVQTLDGRTTQIPSSIGKVTVLVFLRTDCPLGKRYAPELGRIAKEFSGPAVQFWMVFPDKSENAAEIRSMMSEYRFPGTAVRDPDQSVVKQAHATTAPEAAVFGRNGKLLYHGRIDDRYVDYGKVKPEPQVHDLEDAIRAALAGKAVARAETQAFGCALADIE